MAGRGWAWTAYDWDEGRLFNYIGDAQNTFPIWNATPLVALDVYEHAYFLDYQTDRASYIDAFFDNLDWGVVNDWVAAVPDPAELRPLTTVVFVVAGYLAGQLPFGYWLVRLAKRRGHPHGRQRQHRRDQRLADVRARSSACR